MKTSTRIQSGQLAKAAAQASELMKTLGHKDRLMVLCHLVEGEKSVGELTQLLEIPQSRLSQHLARMRQESMVKTRREAQTIYYSIDSPKVEQIIEVVHDIFCS